MAFPRNSLRAFLGYARASLRSTLASEPSCSRYLTFVIGNESADLDSLTSSLLYAYFRSIHPPPNAFTKLYIPILNIPREDIRLRPEFLALFKHANITEKHIVTLDDLPDPSVLETELPPNTTHWMLVDHNSLQHQLGFVYGNHVQGVIDHHVEENFVPKDTEPEPRVIEKAGSCTSLVVRTFQEDWQTISDESMASGAAHAQGDSLANDRNLSALWDSQLAKLALGSVLIDTSNLTSKTKVMQTDVEVVTYLEDKIHIVSPGWDRKAFYVELDTAKRAIDDFKVQDILKKDWKQWVEKDGRKLGIASVVKPLDFLSTKAATECGDEYGLEMTIHEIMGDRDLSMLAIMTNSKASGGGRTRELLVQTRPDATVVRTFFDDHFHDTLELEAMDLRGVRQGEEHRRNVWLQKNVSQSRKQVAPLLRHAMNEA